MRILVVCCSVLLSSCAYLHHAQIGDIDNRRPGRWKAISVLVSETGINIKEAANIAERFATKADQGKFREVANIVSMFQMGPRTGNLVYTDKYAEPIIDYLYTQCPSGKLTGLMAVRETRKYPIVSGEIVKITGYCLR